MTPAQWQKVKGLLDEALELRTTERGAFLETLGDEEPEVRAEVESLLRAHDAQPDFLEPPRAGDAANDSVTSDSAAWVGRVLGSYRLLELIGEGGMGAIFRAVRADGLHERPVAVKLIRSGLSKEFFLRRFNEERRILASLDHPNIARLLDGGASLEGTPYVVMEFIDGLPIDVFCARQQLSIRARLELFRVVCGAVQYAHQNLIVHRDLKPANILVTKDGQPKLLDFGIAKIHDPRQGAEVDRSLTLLPIMTPDFASPEQVRGASITTASDIYSLGVILYVLLTGQRPYGSAHLMPHEIMKAICETTPPKPSGTVLHQATVGGAVEGTIAPRTLRADSERRERHRLRRALRGDIDSIVLKALRKEPHERYATVEQLSEDIRRHLEGLPVKARRGTAGYRLRKFTARHAAGVSVAAVVAGLLIASVIVSVREARVARVEAARAERRFNDVRELARSLVFDVHDAIRDLPGSTPARKILIDRALKYLDGLSSESGSDPALMRELAAAYERVGEVEGHFLQSNLGDAARSLDSYQRALKLRLQLASGNPRDRRDQLALASCQRRVANQLWATGNIRGARDEIAEAIAVASALPQSLDVLTEESAEYNLQAEIFGNTEMGGLADPAAALQSVRHEEQVVAAMLKLSPDSSEVQHSYQLSILKLGDMLQAAGDLQGALLSCRQALDVAQRLQQRSPTAKNARQVAVAHNHIAVILDLLADRVGSLSSSRESLEIYRQLLTADPRNELMQRGVAMAELNVGTQLALGGESQAGVRALDEGVRMAQSMVAVDPRNLRDLSMLAGAYEGRGDVRTQLHEPQLAQADYAKACELYEQARSADPSDAGDSVLAAECQTRLGRVLLSQRRTESAVKSYQRALVLLKPLLSATSPDVDALYLVADAYAGLGDSELARIGLLGATAEQDLGHWQGARTWYASSLDTWQKIPHAQYQRSPSLPVDSPDRVDEKLHRCELALASHLPRNKAAEVGASRG